MYAVQADGQVALELAAPQPQDYITLLAEQPVADDGGGTPPRLAALERNHQPPLMLDEIEREGLEGRLAAEARAFQGAQPRPETVVQRVPGLKLALALHYSDDPLHASTSARPLRVSCAATTNTLSN